jgi:hypothetical protein
VCSLVRALAASQDPDCGGGTGSFIQQQHRLDQGKKIMDFWEAAAAANGEKNDVKTIFITTAGFSADVPGVKYFEAVDAGGGRFTLSARDTQNEQFCKAVYWLPYRAGIATSASRSVYENMSGVDFFLTVELSGCRVSVTDKCVYHVAYDATAGRSGAPSSALRAAAEEAAMKSNSDDGHDRARRVSFSGDGVTIYGYGFYNTNSRATVVGLRVNQEWVYKLFIYNNLDRIEREKPDLTVVQILNNAGLGEELL